MRPPRRPPHPNPQEVGPAVAFLVNEAGAVLDGRQMQLVTATLLGGTSIARYVARSHPDLDAAARQRAYQRIKRRHSRLLVRLRRRLAARRVSPSGPSAPFPSPTTHRVAGGSYE